MPLIRNLLVSLDIASANAQSGFFLSLTIGSRYDVEFSQPIRPHA